jgi:secreted Zn-dependent insulinase-like peptidase
LLLLRRLLGEPAFTELRTKQQLGYIVSLSSTGYGR